MSGDAGRTEAIAAAVAETALACPGVAALSGGPYGTAATYLPGGRVEGVVVRQEEVEVHIVAAFGPPLPELAEGVRVRVHRLAPGRSVTVVIVDLAGGPA